LLEHDDAVMNGWEFAAEFRSRFAMRRPSW